MKKQFNVALEADDVAPPAETPPAETPAVDPAVEETPAVAEESVKGAIIGGLIGTVAIPIPIVGTAVGAFVGHHLTKEALENISLEEEHILLNEANMHHSAAETHLSEIGRIMELSEALEDLAVIADGIGEATPAEIALIENAGNMAAAGSDVDPARIVPAMESYIGGKVSMESIRETAATIWANIQNFLKKVWEHIEEFFKMMVFTVPRMQTALLMLQDKVRAARRDGKKHDGGTVFEVAAGANLLYVNGKVLKTEKEIINAYEQLVIASKWVFKDYAESVVERGRIIASAIEEFSAADIHGGVANLRNELKAWKPSNVPGAGATDTKRFPGFATTLGTPLMGNQSLACKYFNDNKEDVSPLAALDRQRNSRCEMIPTQETVTAKASQPLEVATMSLDGMEALLAEVSVMLDVLAKYKFGSAVKNINDAKQQIAKYTSRAQGAIESFERQVKTSENYGKENPSQHRNDTTTHLQQTLMHFRAMANFNVAYTRWAQSPSMAMMRHSVTVSKAMMMVVQKSLVEYE